jgi:nucleotide-binding universal stress UspA family protein
MLTFKRVFQDVLSRSAMNLKISKILCPTDYSDLSLQAVKYARAFAGTFAAQIHCLHVVDEAYLHWNAMGPEGAPMVPPVEDLTSYAENHMRQFADEHLIGLKYAPVTKVASGRPYDVIVQYALENTIDLIVIATHGRGGIAHALLGSTVEKVVRKACCPVLVVRETEHEIVGS